MTTALHPANIVEKLAEYFCGPDLTLCSMAMMGPEDSTAYRRAVRFLTLREAFGVPGTCDSSDEAREHILRALYRHFAEAPGVSVNPAPREPERCTHIMPRSDGQGSARCVRVKGHLEPHAFHDTPAASACNSPNCSEHQK